MEGADEHRPARVELLRGAAHEVGVGDDPGDHLHLLVPHPAAGDLEIPAAAPAVVVGAVVQEVLDLWKKREDSQNKDRDSRCWPSCERPSALIIFAHEAAVPSRTTLFPPASRSVTV